MKILVSLKRHEILLVLALVLTSGIFSLFSLHRLKKESLRKVETSLVSINTSCNEALSQWLHFRKNNIQSLAKNTFLLSKAQELLLLKQDAAALVSSEHTGQLRVFFQPILDANEDLGVFFIAPNYTSVFSMRDVNTGSLNLMAQQSKTLLDKVLLNKETVLIPPIPSDVVLNSAYKRQTWHTMFIVTPLLHRDKVIAAFSLRLDTYKDFTRILELGKIGETGETIGFDENGIMVSSTRFEKQLKTTGQLSQEKHPITTMNVSQFLREMADTDSTTNLTSIVKAKNITLTENTGCRGQKIYTIQQWNNALNIGIVTKIDKSEALREYYYLRNSLFVILLTIFVLMLFVINLIVHLRQKAEKILVNANEKLEQKVNERTWDLQQTIKTKNKFFSIIAHDLRSPFNGLLGLFDLLLQNPDALSEERKYQMMQQIYNSGSQLFKLLENLLGWSRSQTEHIKIKPEKIVLNGLINENIILQKDHAKNKKIELINEVEQNAVIVAGRNTLDTVIRNLISNAIKFTNEGGSIKVKTVTKKEHINIIVEDNGIGISEDNLQKVFKIDEKVSTKGTQNESGSGLGLVLCKEFVELNKGTISAESEINVGTRFIITLPL